LLTDHCTAATDKAVILLSCFQVFDFHFAFEKLMLIYFFSFLNIASLLHLQMTMRISVADKG
jgi:hypothetical protein